MGWNYRVICREHKSDLLYGIHSVYYHEGGTIRSYSIDPVDLMGESFNELVSELEMMQRALTEPVLNWSELPYHPPQKTGESDAA